MAKKTATKRIATSTATTTSTRVRPRFLWLERRGFMGWRAGWWRGRFSEGHVAGHRRGLPQHCRRQSRDCHKDDAVWECPNKEYGQGHHGVREPNSPARLSAN